MSADDDVMDFCNREMQTGADLDGRQEVHDRFRVDHQGKGSYETIVPKFQEFVKNGAIRATTSAAPIQKEI